jgi:hypothetical protein
MWNLFGILLLGYSIYMIYNNFKKIIDIFNIKEEIDNIKEELDNIKSFIDGNSIVVNSIIKKVNDRIDNLKKD